MEKLNEYIDKLNENFKQAADLKEIAKDMFISMLKDEDWTDSYFNPDGDIDDYPALKKLNDRDFDQVFVIIKRLGRKLIPIIKNLNI